MAMAWMRAAGSPAIIKATKCLAAGLRMLGRVFPEVVSIKSTLVSVVDREADTLASVGVLVSAPSALLLVFSEASSS